MYTRYTIHSAFVLCMASWTPKLWLSIQKFKESSNPIVMLNVPNTLFYTKLRCKHIVVVSFNDIHA